MSTQEEIRATYKLMRPFFKGHLRRLWAAAEAERIGRGGIARVSMATGMAHETVSAGIRELHGANTASHDGRGQPSVERRDPGLMAALEGLITDEIAGDPMTEQKWVRCSLRHLSKKLTEQGHPVGRSAVSRLLRKLRFSLRAN